jgi:hypothetical protein
VNWEPALLAAIRERGTPRAFLVALAEKIG